MPIIINWVELNNKTDSCVEIPLFEECFSIHYVDNTIAKTEWNLRLLNNPIEINSQWKDIQRYLNNPTETLTINLKKQGSVFRNKVWAEMCKIPVGQTLTYSALARQIDSGARAVANACRDNPFPVIIPCHRVVAVSGLGGYMGQIDGRALEIKKKLLANEQSLMRRD
jgi:methylated-DNA-[protein]-cysteine S-methyltransferase